MDELIAELKQQGVLQSPRVERAFRAIDRADFVPPEHRAQAYGDYPLPIGSGQTISQPYTVAFMLDLLDPRPGEKILDVGTGSGWQTALLAHVVSQDERQKTKGEGKKGKVFSMERVPELCTFGKRNIQKYNFLKTGAVELVCGNATAGLPSAAPFDKIIAAAAGDEIPPAWREQVKTGGTIVAPVGNSVWRITKRGGNEWDEEEFPGFVFVPLVHQRAGEQKSMNREQESVKRRNAGGSRPRSRYILWCFALLALASGVGSVAFQPVHLTSGKKIEIPAGYGSRMIAALLVQEGVIGSKWAFVTYATLIGRASDLKPGRYVFSGEVTVPEAVAMLVHGGLNPNEIIITIPEGWDLRDIGTYLETNGLTTRSHLYAITGAPAHRSGPGERFPPPGTIDPLPSILAVKPPSAILEGYLYPDTYRIFRDAPLQSLVQKMLENFDRKLTPDIRAEIERQGKPVAEVITMASLIEKEVADADDRRTVAGILWSRLAADIPLQVDATINYVTGKHATPSGADLAINSPYNTYRHTGLPPTPIANPGLGAIRAAIAPRASDYRYYLSPPDGRTIFSRTLEEHVGAKARYLTR